MVDAVLFGPKEPLAHRGTEEIHVEARHQSGIQVGQLIFLTIVHGSDDAAAGRQGAACQLAVERQVHDRLQDFGAGTVHFVQEEHHGLVVHGEPIGWHELGLAGLLVLVGQADEVARVTHLTQEQGDDGYALVLKVAGDDFALADAVLTHEQDVLC